MANESVELRDLGSLKARVDKLRACEDEPVRKEAEAVYRQLMDAEGNLEGVAFTLSAVIWPQTGHMVTTEGQALAGLLAQLPRPSDARQESVASLLALSRLLEQRRTRSDAAATALFPDDMTLKDIRQTVDGQNERCQQYADLFAALVRSISTPDGWTKPLDIDDRSMLKCLLVGDASAPMDLPPLPEVAAASAPMDPPPLPAECPLPPAREPSLEPPVLPTSTQEPLPTSEMPVAPQSLPSSTRGDKCADVLFVIDASGSMRTCFHQLRDNLRRFVEPFHEAGFDSLRLGLLAYSANIDRTRKICVYRNVVIGGEGALAMRELYGGAPAREGHFFTCSRGGAVDTEAFLRRLDGICCKGDEDSIFALDCAADFPFGPLESTRRVVVLFTDEKIEDGVLKEESVGANYSLVVRVMKKFVDRHITLYAFAPASPVSDTISEFSRVFMTAVPEFQPNGTDTWANVDFNRVLETMGKSVSSSLSGGREQAFARATFGQDGWTDDRWA